jgi:hypothetical protein
LAGIARDKYSGRWTDLTTNQLGELRLKCEAYDDQIREHHLPGGMIASVRYATTNRSEPVAYAELEHSAAWTGLYLAACSYRYAVVRESRQLADVRLMLDGLTRAVRSTGRPGVIPRHAGRAADDLYSAVYSRFGGEDPARPGFGKLAHRGTGDSANLVWLGGPSREDYAGVNLGLATAWYYVRDLKIRAQISNIVQMVAGRMEADGWRLDDGKGNVTFAGPWLAAAWLRTAATVEPRRFGPAYERRIADMLALREDANLPDPGLCRYCDPLPGMMRLANVLALNRNETDPIRRVAFQEILTRTWHQSQMNLDPWLAVSYLGAFDKIPSDSTARTIVQGLLLEYPPAPRWASARDNTGDPTIERVRSGEGEHARFALPFALRPVAPFQWAQSATLLAGGEDAPVAHPGVDLLLAYWMGRDLGITPGEDSVAPLELNLRPPNLRLGRTNAPGSRRTNTMRMHSSTNTPRR